ncbi:peptide chain release factor N(5)-glutamine methyltransferase [Limibaculum sp. FT325]|uniref:peptide chain release factor N(5)-glutamine methyltransferase n=1 Tax=Thermohalobaculum sediminis TaxID=2939436 RepID=UPI0020BE2376|nr:peptide chain release factor N(5)-glutamine methyltransferase [Limibaculum sediminis]MCL5778540.1 peptide chain release factor N(5)-glutamine methyltransferase [Limibaculum sediminis]
MIRRAVPRLAAAGVTEAERDARLICRWAAGLSGAGLAARLHDPASADEVARFEAAIARRAARVPVSQITGTRAFWGRDFRVTADVLDPRPETETLIETALAGGPAARVLDLGTGSGCIIVTLLAEWPGAAGVGVDLSAAALEVARANAHMHGVEGRLRLLRSDWFGAVEGTFELIVSNPPYIAEDEMAGLAPEVALHEPRIALTPGGDGLGAYRAIAAGATVHLAPGGRLIVETGVAQAERVGAIFEAAGFDDYAIVRDLNGHERVVLVRNGRKIAEKR